MAPYPPWIIRHCTCSLRSAGTVNVRDMGKFFTRDETYGTPVVAAAVAASINFTG